jgi:hypothetical protein
MIASARSDDHNLAHPYSSACGPGCVKALRCMTAPGVLRLVVTLRAKKRKNSSSARNMTRSVLVFTQPRPEAADSEQAQ